jgi:hypothetical protein
MSGLGVGLRLDIGLEPDADTAELEDAASQLRQERLDVDVGAVERLPGEVPPPGTRAVEVALLAALVVNVWRGAIGAVVQMIQALLPGASSWNVKVTLGRHSIEVTNVSDEGQGRLIVSFVARHASCSP